MQKTLVFVVVLILKYILFTAAWHLYLCVRVESAAVKTIKIIIK